MKKKVRHVSALVLCTVLLLCSSIKGSAFSLIGPNNPGQAINNPWYYSFTPPGGAPAPLPTGTAHQGFLNHTDPMGWPVPIKQFYRWNWPELWYSFDNQFIRYFGHDGVQAVHNAFEVLNDYFEPQDGSYSGVSSMDLVKEFDQHFATWKKNPSAEAENVYDIESLVLGLLVNHLGLGNPHRHCFTIRDIHDYLPGNPAVLGDETGSFQVAVRNYDPYNYQPTSIINGVNYSYFISILNENPGGADPLIFDAVEYAISTEARFSAVAAIRDVFNISTIAPAVVWNWPGRDQGDIMFTPTAYWEGVYYAPDDPRDLPTEVKVPQPLHSQTNLIQLRLGDPLRPLSEVATPATLSRKTRTQPRHTLTFDDAGGLRYLYRTNNIVWENYDAQVTLIEAAAMNLQTTVRPGKANFPFPNQSIRPIIQVNNVTPLIQNTPFRPQVTFAQGMIRAAMRGGIDRIKFHYFPYDSLLDQTFQAKISIWTDVFVQNMLPTDSPPANPPYFSQVVGRTVAGPDFLFSADDYSAANMITFPAPGGDWDTTMIDRNWNNVPFAQPGQPNARTTVMLGPGVIERPADAGANNDVVPLQYIFNTRAPIVVDRWQNNPDLSIYRQDELAVLFQWGWITNSGPNDYIRFPQVNDNISQVESILGPAGTVAKITHLTVYDGLNDEYRSAPWDIDRSRDTVIIYGQRLDSVTSIKVLDHNTTTVNGEYKTLQTIDARRHIMSDQQIVLPPGTLSDETVSPLTNEYYRRIALVNPKGDSDSEFIYEISDGRPLVMSAQYDGTHLNTAKSLIIRGSGFKLSQGFVNQIWFFEGDEGNGSYNLEPNSGIGMFDINNATAYPTPLAILDINPLNTGFTSSTGVPVNHSEIVVTDTMIYIPPHLISDGNYTFGKFGDLGESLDGRMSRSEASPNPGIDNWSRKIRVAYNSNATGQPDMSVILSPPRAHVQRFWSIGVGGDRNSSSGYSRTLPTITEVFTTLEDPAVNPGEQNSTWTRNDPGDFLVIRGTGLDLAKGINFVDGRGNPIQTIDTAGLTGGPPDAPIIMANLRDLPGPPSISNQADAGLLLDGVEIRTYPPLGRDGYEIRIQPVLFGLGAANVNYWDSETGLDPPNNQIGSRRVVIETPFGTAIAPRRQEIEIWFQP